MKPLISTFIISGCSNRCHTKHVFTFGKHIVYNSHQCKNNEHYNEDYFGEDVPDKSIDHYTHFTGTVATHCDARTLMWCTADGSE